MSKPVFTEEQRFNQPFVIIMLALAFVVVFFVTYQEMDATPRKSSISLIVFVLASAFIFFIKLKTRIDEKGIHIRFSPFHLNWVTYSWEQIYSIETTTYSPIGDYGGWGIRFSFRGKGKAFNTRGNEGIKIVTDEGKTRLIGTQKRAEAQQVIDQYRQEK